MACHREHGTDVGIARIFNTYGPRLAPATAGSSPTSSSRRWRASRSPSTATGPRPGASATSTTRSGAPGPARLRRDGSDQPRQPRRAHRAGARPRRARGHRVGLGDRPPAAARRRPGAAPAGHHPGPDVARVGAQHAVEEGLRSNGRVLLRREETRPDMAETMPEDEQPAQPPGAPRVPTLSVIVPVYNERATVAEIIRRMRAVSMPLALDVIVVDDGSTDGTDKVLAAIEDSTVRVITHERNQGKGAAIRTGLGRPRATSCSSRTPTSSTTPTTGPGCSSPRSGAGPRSSTGAGSPASARTCSRCTGSATGSSRSSPTCCTRRRSRTWRPATSCSTAACSRASRSSSDRFDFEPEITAKVLRRGYRIYEVPISYAGREFPEGKKITWRDGFGALWALVRFRFSRDY